MFSKSVQCGACYKVSCMGGVFLGGWGGATNRTIVVVKESRIFEVGGNPLVKGPNRSISCSLEGLRVVQCMHLFVVD